jgi:hypothetical protein
MTARSSCRRAGLTVAGASVLLGLAGCSGGATEVSPEPTTSPPTTSSATAPDAVPLNGQVTDAETYFGVNAHSYGWRSFDPVSETGLFVTGPVGNADYELRRLAVVGRTGRIATLTCRELPCAQSSWLSYPAALGPGTDEVTVRAGERTAQVIGYDGTWRRTLDLGGTTAAGAEVWGLRWSPDGRRRAVFTHRDVADRGFCRMWLVDRGSGHAQLAYSLSSPGAPRDTHDATDVDGKGCFWGATGWGWSPDGKTLLLEVRTRNSPYGAEVVVLRLQPDGAADPVIARTLYHSNRHFDWAGNVAWSPDGTRIAVRTRKHITEISAEDGSVLARHPQIEGWLIWPAKEDRRT